MAAVKSWKFGDPEAPFFPEEYEILKKAVLQITDIKSNHNKYYALELHSGTEKGKQFFRVFSHYGRTDDLELNPNAGQKECRHFDSLGLAEAGYQSIYREKTSTRKGYKELSLASSKIGSQKARGTSSGQIDDQTLQRSIAPKNTADTASNADNANNTENTNNAAAVTIKGSELPQTVQTLIRYLYDEATHALTSTVAAKITAQGIETPLGILTLGQIEKGEKILADLFALFQKKKKNAAEMERLSGEFYTAIPHRIGRSRSAVATAVIDSLSAFEQKQETLQLMKDMLQVNGEGGSVLFDAKVDTEYKALKCTIATLDPKSPVFQEMAEYIVKSQVKMKSVKVKNIFTLRRENEWEQFSEGIGNHKLLFHGSRIQNWVGILSRGILLPKIVVSLGVNRTDAGWLGNGIYFGDASCTSACYATPGKKGTRFLTLARVALGKIKDYHKITYGLATPPEGYDSCHGVRRKKGVASEFDDDEYVIYTTAQQRLEYLAEITV